jgi:hypothetical protein
MTVQLNEQIIINYGYVDVKSIINNWFEQQNKTKTSTQKLFHGGKIFK